MAYDAYGTGFNKDAENPYIKDKYGIKPTAPKTAIAGGRESADGGPIPRASIMPSKITNPSYNPNGTRQGADDIPESTYRDGPPPPSLLETLLGHLQEQYQRPDPSQFDTSIIDNALKDKLGLIENLKAQTQGNFDKSDVALQGMHDAFKHSIETDSANRFNQIADQQKSMLGSDVQNTVNALTASREKATNERADMLQRLGIQAAGAAVDPGNTAMDRGIADAQAKGLTDQTLADNRRASDLALNNTMAQSVGMAGVQRRAALQNQLQAILGKADMAEMDAKSQSATAKANLINDAQGNMYKAFNDRQDRYQKLFDTILHDNTLNSRYQMQYGNNGAGGGGMGSLANSLQGVDPEEAANGLAALSDILGNGNYLDGANGPNGTTPYDRTAVLANKLVQDKHINPSVALQIATGYNKLPTLK